MTAPVTPPPDESPGRITPAKSLEADQAVRSPPTGTSFESHLQKGAAPGTPAPFETSHLMAAQNTSAPTMNTLVDQAKVAQDGLGTVGQQLNTPNLKLKRSQSHLLKNKLGNAQTYAQEVAAKLNVEVPPGRAQTGSGSIEKFLSYVGDGQNQFIAIQKKLEEMSASNDPINAADMLMIQSKMNVAQQEIEYSSTLLSKVTSSMTTIMNIQL